jgi:hypothetical protein
VDVRGSSVLGSTPNLKSCAIPELRSTKILAVRDSPVLPSTADRQPLAFPELPSTPNRKPARIAGGSEQRASLFVTIGTGPEVNRAARHVGG